VFIDRPTILYVKDYMLVFIIVKKTRVTWVKILIFFQTSQQ